MKHIDDERIRLYLKHRELINQWAAIADELPKVTHQFLKSLRSDVKEVARKYDVHPWLQEEISHPKYLLVRREWLANAETPRVGVGLEWRRKDVGFFRNPPYIGAWVNIKLESGPGLYNQLKDSFGKLRVGAEYHADGSWPIWKHIKIAESQVFWDDLEPYRRALLTGIDEAWIQFAQTVDDALMQKGLFDRR